MTESKPGTPRRTFLEKTGLVATGSALAGVAIPAVHAAEDNTIRIALVGCGGRGTGAAGDALSTRHGPIKLVAMADVFEERLCSSYELLEKEHHDKVEESCENKFIGFDGYKHAIDLLKPGDVVILTTPPAFRWVHFSYAIRKDKLYNEVKRGALASLVTSMGRMAAHTGQIVTFDEMLNCKCEFAPDVDKLTMTTPAQLQLDRLTKRYPAPQPGIIRDREYLV